MRLAKGGWFEKGKGFLGRLWKGAKRFGGAVWNGAKRAGEWVKNNVPAALEKVGRVLNVLPKNKYTDGARTLVDKGKDLYKKGEDTVKKWSDKGDEIRKAWTGQSVVAPRPNG